MDAIPLSESMRSPSRQWMWNGPMPCTCTTASSGDAANIAVPFGAVTDVAKEIADAVRGKVVVDATNALDEKMALAVGYTTSGAEELQKKLPDARVVKTFNMVFAQHMETGRLGDVFALRPGHQRCGRG